MRRIAALLTVSLTAGLIGLASPASAEKHEAPDGIGDTVVYGEPDDTKTDSADVVKSVVNHSARKMNITVWTVDLRPGLARAGVYAMIRTDGRTYELALRGRDRSGSEFELSTNLRGREVICPGKKKTVSAGRDFIRLSVPRKCLGSPRWIKVGLGATRYNEPDYLTDDALRPGLRQDGYPTFGPRLKRG